MKTMFAILFLAVALATAAPWATNYGTGLFNDALTAVSLGVDSTGHIRWIRTNAQGELMIDGAFEVDSVTIIPPVAVSTVDSVAAVGFTFEDMWPTWSTEFYAAVVDSAISQADPTHIVHDSPNIWMSNPSDSVTVYFSITSAADGYFPIPPLTVFGWQGTAVDTIWTYAGHHGVTLGIMGQY